MIIKEFHCDACDLDFEAALPICVRCKRKARRVFLTPPNIGSVKEQNVNRILDEVLPAQHLSNYSNATGYPKPTFSNIYQNASGMLAGWGDPGNVMKSLGELGVPTNAPLTQMDIETGRTAQVDISAIAAGLPKAVSVENSAKVAHGGSLLKKMAVIEAVHHEGSK